MMNSKAIRRLSGCLGLALLGGLAFIETMPFTPNLREWVDPLADQLGISQDRWGMFAPNVDSMNLRIIAEIEYADGEQRTWESPDWSQYRGFSRFLRLRECEFLDSAWQTHNIAAWSPLADDLARRVRPEGKPVRVKLWARSASFPDPNEGGWKINGPVPFEEKLLFHDKVYPQ